MQCQWNKFWLPGLNLAVLPIEFITTISNSLSHISNEWMNPLPPSEHHHKEDKNSFRCWAVLGIKQHKVRFSVPLRLWKCQSLSSLPTPRLWMLTLSMQWLSISVKLSVTCQFICSLSLRQVLISEQLLSLAWVALLKLEYVMIYCKCW